MKKRLLLSFSSGATSAFMTQWCLENLKDRYEMIVVFANTGEEKEESLLFADRCDKHFGFNLIWVEAITDMRYRVGVKAKVVTFQTADREAAPFKAMVAKHGIPNRMFKHCSRELKQRAIEAYLRSIGWKDYFKAIGIRADEVDRISEHRKTNNIIYPLISMMPMGKPDINSYWSKMPFRLGIKGYEGNCKVCWKKSLRKLLTLARLDPSLFDNFRDMEQDFENYIPASRIKSTVKPPLRFYRGNLSVDQILAMSKLPFEDAIDDSLKLAEYKQTEIFGYELDVSNGCVESCEAFD